MRRIAATTLVVGTFGLGALATAVLMFLVLQLGDLVSGITSDVGTATLQLFKLLIPVAAGVILARAVSRRLSKGPRLMTRPAQAGLKRRRIQQVAAAVLALGYLATWMIGGPSVQSSLDREAFEAWKRIEARQHDSELQAFPHIRTLLVLPVAPGLVLSYHEFQVAMLHGWGGWTLHFWYGIGSRELVRLSSWIS
jgi:hypothetical protein